METIYVVILFVLYVALWAIKRKQQIKATGLDPEVLAGAQSAVQRYFFQLTRILTVCIIILIFIHGIEFQFYSMFSRFPPLDDALFDHIGLATGITGLTVCFIAQRHMKNSWRVGIDEKNHADLVETGMYRIIRNPTYFGLYLLCAGTWLIWPTWTIALFSIIFYLALEMQVRCEEDFLLKTHGDEYREYLKRTKRYIPRIY